MGGKIAWAAVTYNLLMIVYAANNIPYCALSGVITSDSIERTSLASWRFVFAMAAAMAVNMFTVRLVELLGHGNPQVGYPLTMSIWGSIAIVFFVITFLFTKERIRSSTPLRSTIWRDLRDLTRSGPWLALFLLAVLIYIQLAMRSGAMLYYFNYYLHPAESFGWIDGFGIFNGVGLTFTILGVAMSKPLVSRMGKRTTFRICLFLSGLLMGAFAFVPPGAFYLSLLLQVMLQLAFGPTIPILWAMMADVADYLTWTTHRQFTALAFASIIFGLKLGFGVGGWINGQLLEKAAYAASAAPSESAKLVIVMMVSVLPGAVLMLGVVVLFAYRLDDQLVERVTMSLRSELREPEAT
jgi:Na+/melibiose symporter-like transporter